MKCQNCGENEANVRYTQIINGVKKELALCDECSKKLGIQSLDFNIPINFSSFLGDFIEEADSFFPSFVQKNELKCDKCGMTYDEFIKLGKFGCSNCYEVFENKIDNMLKNIHGTNVHQGKRYKLKEGNIIPNTIEQKEKDKKTENEQNELNKLEQELKTAIQEERYEDAAIIRDKIKKQKEDKNV